LAIHRSRRRITLHLVAAAAVIAAGIGLFTSIGTPATGGPPHVGGGAPTFSLSSLTMKGKVGTPENGGAGGRPLVVLFMGDWCTVCHTELPPLAAKIDALRSGRDDLRQLAVIGVDSEDTQSAARAFIKASGITFPVGDDGTAHVMNGLYGFQGDPYAVFIEGNGTIMAIHPGPLSPDQLVTLERKLMAA
jgi:peroxiredoxin